MNPAFIIFNLNKIIKDFNRNILAFGWHSANKLFIHALGIRIKTNSLNIIHKGAVLIYANHPTGIDPYIISAVFPRDDLYIISDVYQTKKGAQVAKHLIPVYYSSLEALRYRSGLAFLGFLMMRIFTGTLKKKDVHRLNLKSLDSAINKLDNGHAICIFPSGGDNLNAKWKKGIGEIIFQQLHKKSKIKLLKCTITDLTENKLLWHFITAKKYFQKNGVSVKFEIMDLDVLRSMNAIEITEYLQTKFKK